MRQQQHSMNIMIKFDKLQVELNSKNFEISALVSTVKDMNTLKEEKRKLGEENAKLTQSQKPWKRTKQHKESCRRTKGNYKVH